MEYLVAVINGIIEGLTEFLPISSTGHLILAGTILNPLASDISPEKLTSFKVFIQLGAILAVTVVYWRRILQLLGLRKAEGPSINLLHVFIAIVPALGLAYLLRDFIKGELFHNTYAVIASLITGGILMIIAEKKQPPVTTESIDQMTYRQSLQIGLFQCFSLWPGFSRSGASISGGMLSGVSYRAAADFSFLIAIPIMLAAGGYEFLTIYDTLSVDDVGFFATGFGVAFVVALIVVISALKWLTKIKLSYFAYYRFVLAGCFWLFILN
jgi:undecaprenyl-diphosphatase